MKPIIDLHTHTIASGHAYSTWTENVTYAKEAGLKAIGISEHARMMPGTCHDIYFLNFKVLPKKMDDMLILNGIEANIYDYDGNIDVSEEALTRLDYVIASHHTPCIENGGIAKNTQSLIKAMQNPYIKIIGHPDDSRYPLDYDELTKAAAQEKVALELNNSSINPLSVRVGAKENIRKMLEKCIDNHTMIIMGTDSHYCGQVGHFEDSLCILKELDFPKEQIVNLDISRLDYVLNR